MIFDNISPTSKAWVYVSSQKIDDNLLSSLNNRFKEFFTDWKSHGQLIDGEFKVIDDYIIVIGAGVKNGNMCGRAVDAQIRFIKELDEQLDLDLLNRNKIAFNVNEKLSWFDFKEIQSLIKEKKISHNTLWCNTFLNNNQDDIFIPFDQSPFASMYFS
tara:strand:+ start:16154 stop:16627 length:474 start_codon:yes stop_codon:yes gene_type:complete